MLGSIALDVAIGLIFIYLVASLVASAVNELIENWLKNRAKDLERGITELLGDKTKVAEVYNHALVLSLYKGANYQAARNGELPSYIPSRNFALALMDIISGGGDGLKNATGPRISGAAAEEAPPPQITALLQGAERMNEPLRTAVLALIRAAGNDASRVRLNIENWFDSSMDRVSGWYKRRAQQFLLVIGVVLAAAGNIDTINIANVLSRDSGKRDALVAQAREYASRNPEPSKIASKDDPVLKSIEKMGLPIGWAAKPGAGEPSDPRSLPDNFPGWLAKLFGIALTAAAISLGSPFWFDTLNKFVVVRSTVKPTEKSPPEKPKD